jgi:hypothetical protein
MLLLSRCSVCEPFDEQLIQLYHYMNNPSVNIAKRLEIIYISSDHSQEDFDHCKSQALSLTHPLSLFPSLKLT